MATLPILHDIHRVTGEKINSSYIVLLNDGVDKDAFILTLQRTVDSSAFTLGQSYSVIHAFSGLFSPAALEVIQKAHEVQRIEENAVFELDAKFVQTPAPWGLNRISQKDRVRPMAEPRGNTFRYAYDDSATLEVDIYIIDSGIYVEHSEFEGRARWGYVYPGLPQSDEFGHGTGVAGVAGGKEYGVYKKAQLIAVKVASDKTTTSEKLLGGIEFVLGAATASQRPSIANISLGFGDAKEALLTIDKAVDNLTKHGIHVCVSAGNDNIDAAIRTPARVATCNTVGAMNIADIRWSLSNYGPSVSFYAPGEEIHVPAIGGTRNEEYVSGTSFAAPHVSGLIAYLIALKGNTDPGKMTQYLKDTSISDVLKSIPASSWNRLVNNGFLDTK